MTGKLKEQAKSEFTHLHVHFETSILDGINRIDELPAIVKAQGGTALSQTDHGTLAGSYQFYKSCKKAGIKPILGMEAYYTIQDHSIRERDEMGERYYHLVLLAKNPTGWKNLVKLSSLAYTEGLYYKPRLSDALLANHSEGIIATTACLGSAFAKLLLQNRRDEAERLIDGHLDMFGKDNFKIEVQLHDDPEQEALNKALLEIAAKRNIPPILTADAHYTHQEHKALHEQALCMQTNGVMHDPKRFSFGPIDVHVGTPQWMAEQAVLRGIPLEALSNTTYVADSIDDRYFADIKNHYPKFPLPLETSSWEHLEKRAKRALTKKFGGIPPEAYRTRLLEELKAIKKMGFSDYILIVDRFINYAKEELNVIPGPGRGSCGGSLVCYALGITQLDPIKYNLLFSRFLNVGRAGSPLIFTEEMRQL